MSCDVIVTRPDSVVTKVDNSIQWINLYPLDNAVGFPITNPVERDLSAQ